MTLMPIVEIQKQVEEIARRLGSNDYYLPTFCFTEDFARPAIYVDQRGYHYVIVERGIEQSKQTSQDIKDLLYWIFDDITFSMACDYDLKNREEDKDFRRLLFKEQERLIGQIDIQFQEKLVRKHQEILKTHPFEDQTL
jgi:hypothetical protein